MKSTRKRSRSIHSQQKQSSQKSSYTSQQSIHKSVALERSIINYPKETTFQIYRHTTGHANSIVFARDHPEFNQIGDCDQYTKLLYKLLKQAVSESIYIVFDYCEFLMRSVNTISNTMSKQLIITDQQPLWFKHLRSIKKYSSIKTLVDIGAISQLSNSHDIPQIIRELKNNKKYIDIIQLNESDIFDNKFRPFYGEVFKFKVIGDSIQLLYQICTQFHYILLCFTDLQLSIQVSELVESLRNRSIRMKSNVMTTHDLIVYTLLKNDTFKQILESPSDNSNSKITKFRRHFKEIRQLLFLVYEITTQDITADVRMYDVEWKRYNIPNNILPYILVSNLPKMNEALAVQQMQLNGKEVIIKDLIVCKNTLNQIVEFLFQKKYTNIPCQVNLYDIVQLTPALNKLRQILKDIPYEICGSLRRERIRGISNINIIIHEQYREHILQQFPVSEYIQKYSHSKLTINGNSDEHIASSKDIISNKQTQFYKFQLTVQNIKIKINISFYNDINKGVVQLLETGNIAFNENILERLRVLGMMVHQNTLKHRETGVIIQLKTEDDFFKKLGLKLIPPKYRTSGNFSSIWLRDSAKQSTSK